MDPNPRLSCFLWLAFSISSWKAHSGLSCIEVLPVKVIFIIRGRSPRKRDVSFHYLSHPCALRSSFCPFFDLAFRNGHIMGWSPLTWIDFGRYLFFFIGNQGPLEVLLLLIRSYAEDAYLVKTLALQCFKNDEFIRPVKTEYYSHAVQRRIVVDYSTFPMSSANIRHVTIFNSALADRILRLRLLQNCIAQSLATGSSNSFEARRIELVLHRGPDTDIQVYRPPARSGGTRLLLGSPWVWGIRRDDKFGASRLLTAVL